LASGIIAIWHRVASVNDIESAGQMSNNRANLSGKKILLSPPLFRVAGRERTTAPAARRPRKTAGNTEFAIIFTI
jgi:hypothetical protein